MQGLDVTVAHAEDENSWKCHFVISHSEMLMCVLVTASEDALCRTYKH